MGKFYEDIPEHLIEWVRKQHMFAVATAPLSPTGHVNVSTKGVGGTFHVVDSTTVWYEDLTGSGSETIAHLRENGRITILFSAFEGPPTVCRLFGTGKVHEFGTPEYYSFIPKGTRTPGSRAVIVVDVHKVGTSCGFGVPFYDFVGHRDTLLNTANMFEKRDVEDPNNISDKGLKAMWRMFNIESIDGLPSLSEAAYQSVESMDAVRELDRYGVVEKKKNGKAKEDAGKVVMKVRGVGSAWLGREEARLMLAFLLGAVISVFLARVTGGAVEL